MKSEVLHAITDDGTSLAIIDVTHPAFALAITDAEFAGMADRYLVESRERPPMTAEVVEALKNSVLGSGLFAASGSFLSGLNTYRLKLGSDHVGEDVTPIDRFIAASFPAITMRLRLQDMARLLADGIASVAAKQQRSICFINIAGGPAPDTWNALIHLQSEHPGLLASRKIVVAVLDLDRHGPSFGKRAFTELRASAAPLAGLDLHHQHLAYDWSQPDSLTEILADLRASEAICAISSEGGLFEYGSDEHIVANLRQLHAGTAPDAILAGTVTRYSEFHRASHADIQIPLRPRTLDSFRRLALDGGWSIQQAIERPMNYTVRLAKS